MNNFAAFSSQTVTPQKAIGDNLNYNFDYVYDENYAHRLVRAGDRHYQYDANGNITVEQDGSFEGNGEDVSYHKITQEADGVYSTDYGWGLFAEDNANAGSDSSSGSSTQRYKRTYTWNEHNQLVSSVDSNYSTAYVYGQDGQRSNKYTQSSETLYFNKMWTLHTDSGNSVYGGQCAKNIYLGETRIVTKLNSGNNPVKYVDPDGNEIKNAARTLMNSATNIALGKSSEKISEVGCVLTAYTRMASAILGDEISLSVANKIGVNSNLFSGDKDAENLLSPENGAALVNAILAKNGVTNTTVSFDGSYTGQEAVDKYKKSNSSEEKYFATIRVSTHDVKGNKYDHTMNLDGDAYSFGNCGENIKVNDTSGIRKQLVDDPSGRKNKFIRMDFFKINTIQDNKQE